MSHSLQHRHNLTLGRNLYKAAPRYMFWAPNRLNKKTGSAIIILFILIDKLTMAL